MPFWFILIAFLLDPVPYCHYSFSDAVIQATIFCGCSRRKWSIL